MAASPLKQPRKMPSSRPLAEAGTGPGRPIALDCGGSVPAAAAFAALRTAGVQTARAGVWSQAVRCLGPGIALQRLAILTYERNSPPVRLAARQAWGFVVQTAEMAPKCRGADRCYLHLPCRHSPPRLGCRGWGRREPWQGLGAAARCQMPGRWHLMRDFDRVCGTAAHHCTWLCGLCRFPPHSGAAAVQAAGSRRSAQACADRWEHNPGSRRPG